jgi:hypothetical protein
MNRATAETQAKARFFDIDMNNNFVKHGNIYSKFQISIEF